MRFLLLFVLPSVCPFFRPSVRQTRALCGKLRAAMALWSLWRESKSVRGGFGNGGFCLPIHSPHSLLCLSYLNDHLNSATGRSKWSFNVERDKWCDKYRPLHASGGMVENGFSTNGAATSMHCLSRVEWRGRGYGTNQEPPK